MNYPSIGLKLHVSHAVRERISDVDDIELVRRGIIEIERKDQTPIKMETYWANWIEQAAVEDDRRSVTSSYSDINFR